MSSWSTISATTRGTRGSARRRPTSAPCRCRCSRQDRRFGASNVYGHRQGAFDDAAARVAQLFAGPASVVLANAVVLETRQRLAEQLREALSSRAVIEQAKGVLMAAHAIPAEEASARLRHLSQVQHVKLHAVAQRLVDDVTRARGAA